MARKAIAADIETTRRRLVIMEARTLLGLGMQAFVVADEGSKDIRLARGAAGLSDV
jgi:hypothetical protein